jgi:hypothetical protein
LGALCKVHEDTKHNLVHEIRRKTLAVNMGRHLVTAKDKMKLYDDKITALNWTAASEALHQASVALHSVRVLIVGAVDPNQSHEIHPNHRFPKVYHTLREQWRSRVESMRVTIAAAVDRIVEVSEGSSGSIMSISVRKSTGTRAENLVRYVPDFDLAHVRFSLQMVASPSLTCSDVLECATF